MLLNEQQKERLIEAMTAAPVRKVRRAGGRTALIAAVVCALCTIAALAASPTLRDILDQSMGGFVPYSQELEDVSATDQGIRVSVVKSLADESGGTVYLEIQDLTGDRLTEDTTMRGSYVQPMAYDPETRTLLAKTSWDVGYDIRDEDGNATISIQEIWGGESLWDKEILLPAELLEPDNVLETMVLPEDQSQGTYDDRVVLVPNQTPMALEETDLFTLSSAGFDEQGRLHVQVKAAEGSTIPEFGFFVDLPSINAIIEEQGFKEQYHHFSLQGQTHMLEDGLYVDFCVLPLAYDFTQPGVIGTTCLPKELYQGQRVTLSGWIGTRERVEGDWTLTFPVETLPNRTVTVDQVVNTKRIENITLSARSATLRLIHTNNIHGDLSYQPLTVYLSDGTHVTVERGQNTHWYREEEPYYLDTWAFPTPIDPSQAVAFSIGYWYIPLEGDAAQPGHWLAQLPD